MGRSKLLIDPLLMAELLSLPADTEILAAETKELTYSSPLIALTIEGSQVPETKDGYVNAEYEKVTQTAVRFKKFSST